MWLFRVFFWFCLWLFLGRTSGVCHQVETSRETMGKNCSSRQGSDKINPDIGDPCLCIDREPHTKYIRIYSCPFGECRPEFEWQRRGFTVHIKPGRNNMMQVWNRKCNDVEISSGAVWNRVQFFNSILDSLGVISKWNSALNVTQLHQQRERRRKEEFVVKSELKFGSDFIGIQQRERSEITHSENTSRKIPISIPGAYV